MAYIALLCYLMDLALPRSPSLHHCFLGWLIFIMQLCKYSSINNNHFNIPKQHYLVCLLPISYWKRDL